MVKVPGTGCYWNDHGLGSKSDQIAADSITPHAIGQKAEAFEQFEVEGRVDPAANAGVALERGSADWNIRYLHAGHQTAQFKVEVFAIHIIVPGHLCVEVGKQVGGTREVRGVKLPSQSGIEGKREDDFAGLTNCSGFCKANAPLEMIREVVYRAEFCGTRIGNTHVDVGILAEGECQVSRHRRKTDAVRSL